MKYLLAHAQELVYTLASLVPSAYQQESLRTMLGLFLEAKGYPLPQHSSTKSASAALEFIFPKIVVSSFLLYLKQMIPLARSHGFDIHISRCKI
ncbi:hypothetical protein B4U84_03610 [Westiellopsis prolifica IICB1]|nr:hypothetical protein B4U84_03610 [Westiellopsis prolifica IICB1]